MSQPPENPNDRSQGWPSGEPSPSTPPAGSESAPYPGPPTGSEAPTQSIPYQQPPQQPPYGASAYGPPPGYPPAQPKKNTGLIIGLAIAGLIALLSIIVGVVVLTGGDDDSRVTGGETSASSDPSDESDSPASTESPVDGRLTGVGYSYELLDEWNDITAGVLAQNPPGEIDTVSAWGTDIESGRANVIVERQSATATDPEELRETWTNNLGAAVGVTPKSGADLEIAGEKAISATLNSTNDKRVSVEQTAYLTIVDGAVYSITLSAEKGDGGAQGAFDEIVDSWEWK